MEKITVEVQCGFNIIHILPLKPQQLSYKITSSTSTTWFIYNLHIKYCNFFVFFFFFTIFKFYYTTVFLLPQKYVFGYYNMFYHKVISGPD